MILPKLNAMTLHWSTDWTQLFGRSAPLILEIGFGYGAFLLHLARLHPDCNVIGIEIASRCLTAAENAVEREGIANVRVIHSTAETALHHLFEPESLTEIHINFPDPWFKRSHSHRRLMQRDTLDAIVNRLTPEGTLYLATDIVDYAEMSAELLAQTPGLNNLLPTQWVYEMPGRVVTKYEATARREGRPCHYFAYRRNNTSAPDVPVLKDLEMPHIVFKTPLSLDEMLALYAPYDITEGENVVSFMAAFRGRDSLLFEVFVKEPTIEQRFAMLLLQREFDQEYTLKLSTLGHPRPTAGVHHAVAIMGDWLLGLHPDAQTVKRKLQT